ncbi:hypothetical protein SEA_EMOTION_8 [Arthrobacter phage Emotion]|uniref:Uncharacterized protein n=1 Tax=Arthrobacter phage Emotion TaxID=3038361 RepID=A0AA49IGI4_9CAUD|nr:hypothetical protein SEA_EMOTION_8 [Arthrobacter phage Emotion]
MAAVSRETNPEYYDVRPGIFDETVYVPQEDGFVFPLLAEEDLLAPE